MILPQVTIVVCTFNRADPLREAVASLRALQTGGRFTYEVLIVDNASTDHTPQVAADLSAAAGAPVRRIVESRKGVASARNRGVREARGEWIAFFDDDQLADPRWLAELLDLAERKSLRCTGGAVHLRLPGGCRRDLAGMCRVLLGETRGMPREMPYNRRQAPGAGNLLLHKTVFDEVGLFDESLTSGGEDTDLFRRIRAARIDAWYTPAAIVHHIIPAQRLESRQLRWTALRIGGHLARRERQDYGKLFPLAIAARLAQAALVAAPRVLAARLARRPEHVVGADCRLAMWTGYVRSGCALLAPRWFGQGEFFTGMQFRSEPKPLASE